MYKIVLTVDEGIGFVISIVEITSAAYGPQCSAWTVRGAAPLPPDYATNTQGTLLAAAIAGISTIYGDAVPEISFNKTLYNTLYAPPSHLSCINCAMDETSCRFLTQQRIRLDQISAP